jgi:predicted cupin superfamily sugar epimerase
MHARATELIASLGLAPHPEGGYFREVYRSDARVQPLEARPERAALTTIYFLLTSGNVSCWHRVLSDEAWHFYEGDALELFTTDASLEHVTRHLLGPAADHIRPVHVVRADLWQAARSTGAYSLVGCTVAPGFEFADFQMLRERPDLGEIVRRRHPALGEFV